MLLLVASRRDVAAMNIAEKLLEHYDFQKTSESFDNNPTYLMNLQNREIKLIYTKKDSIYTQDLTEHFKPELIIYLSRHSSASGKPTLSVHTPGNLTEKADYGGLPRKVSVSPASAMKNALKEMERLREEYGLAYEVCYECTHHGPSLDVPTMFVELGSSLKQWRDLKAAEVVAHAAFKAAVERETYPAVVGIGGPHYNEKFTRLALKEDIAFGHMVPKYLVSKLSFEVLRQCVERTVEKVESVVLDWKGIRGEDKKRLVEMLDRLGLEVRRV